MESGIIPFNVGQFNCFAIQDGGDYSCNVLLIHMGQHHVLIETGLGRNLTNPPYLLLNRLQAAGTPSSAIDIVIFSHADFDHIGGAIDESGNPTFPNARYVLSKEEWAFWSLQPERLRSTDTFDEGFKRLIYTIPQQRLNQLREKLELIEGEKEIIPGIRLIPAPGHTPGYSVIEITSDNDRLFFIGDLIYESKDIKNPDWFSVFDFDPLKVVMTRHKIFEQAAREHALLMAYHLPFPGLGYVSTYGQGWRWLPYKTKD